MLSYLLCIRLINSGCSVIVNSNLKNAVKKARKTKHQMYQAYPNWQTTLSREFTLICSHRFKLLNQWECFTCL